MKDKTLYIFYLILGIPSAVLSVVLGVCVPWLLTQVENNTPLLVLFGIIMLLNCIVYFIGYIFALMLQFRAWKRLQVLKNEDPKRFLNMPGAGMAIGLQFIPLFNWYWNFIAYVSLWKYAETFLARRNRNEDFRFPRLMGIGFAATNILIQVVSLVMTAVSMVVSFKAAHANLSEAEISVQSAKIQIPFLFVSGGLGLLVIVFFACLVTFMYRFLKTVAATDAEAVTQA